MGGNLQKFDDTRKESNNSTLVETEPTSWSFPEDETNCSVLYDLVQAGLHDAVFTKIYGKAPANNVDTALSARESPAERAVNFLVDSLLKKYEVTPDSTYGIRLVKETTDGRVELFAELELNFSIKSIPIETVIMTQAVCTLKFPIHDSFLEKKTKDREVKVWALGTQESTNLRLRTLPTEGIKDIDEFKKALGID